MARTGEWIALISLSLLALVATSFGQAPTHRPDVRFMRHPGPRRPFTLPPMPAGPLPQVSMNELPSAPPKVSYQGGMLTIAAQNSTLGDILREVHKCTGATIDVPPNATERVATRLGPGPARDVLASLLNGSAFNYVMVGSASDPASLTTVLLTMKPAGAGGETVANAYQPPQQFSMPQPIPAPGTGPGGPVVQPAANDDEADAEDKDDEENTDEDQAQEGQAANGAEPAQDGSQPNAGPKSAEQILEMLRQHQQMTPPGRAPVPPPQVPQQPPDNQ